MKLNKIKNSAKAGFTLIELLVVITIIGILATGATATYTSQIQKARDSTRITDLSALKSGIEQFYQDDQEYPALASFSGISIYIDKFPKDPKSGQTSGEAGQETALDYTYSVSADDNGVEGQEYEISTGFENKGNTTKKANGPDGGDDPRRYEMGIKLKNAAHSSAADDANGRKTAKSCDAVNGNSKAIYVAGACGS